MKSRPVILLVGGTDPSGGAGLAADLKSCSALGGHGCISVTAITIQNSGGVDSWLPIPWEIVSAQMLATDADGKPHGIKTGMLGSSDVVINVAEVIRSKFGDIPFVLDPVMVAGSGDDLAEKSLETVIKEHLLPLATLVTPNLDEAEAFTGKPVRDKAAMEKAAYEIQAMGAENVLIKGGHLKGEPADVLLTKNGITWFPGSRIIPGKVHGTGCTLAASCATLLAEGYSPEKAVYKSLVYLRGIIAGSFNRKLGTLLGHFPAAGPLPEKTDGSAFYNTPRFCPSCAGELIKSEPHPICSRCGLVFYRNPLPAVILILQRKDEILLARRREPPARGELGLPGGFIDSGEHPEHAAKRELEEETTLTGASFELIGAERDHTDYGSVVLYIYKVSNWKGTAIASDDVSQLIWTKKEDIPQLAFPAHDRIAELIKNERS